MPRNRLFLQNLIQGIFVESSFILAQGTFEDGILNVQAFGFPPTEPASKTRAHFGNVNFFGGKRTTNVASSERLGTFACFVHQPICFSSFGNEVRKLIVCFV